MRNSESIKKYFDSIASSYRTRYSQASKLHQYFFNERLIEATRDIDFESKYILDAGAGSGKLYDYIKARTSEYDYLAVDVSKKMLEQSDIPEHLQIVSPISEIDTERFQFDYIFMLGVTTYLSKEEIIESLEKLRKSLNPNGKMIVTFTNSLSIDTIFRKITKRIITTLSIRGNGVLFQDFPISTFSTKQAISTVSKELKVTKLDYLNHTIFPFCLIFTVAQIKIANLIGRKRPSRLKSALSSDLLIVWQKKDVI